MSTTPTIARADTMTAPTIAASAAALGVTATSTTVFHWDQPGAGTSCMGVIGYADTDLDAVIADDEAIAEDFDRRHRASVDAAISAVPA